MEGFTNVGRTADFINRKPKNLRLGGLDVIVLNLDGMMQAFENNCPHQHFSILHQGTIEDCTITCPMHGWTFDLKSGSSTNGNGRLRMRDVKILSDTVWVGNQSETQNYLLFDSE